jgi:hypothetical protein
MLKNPFIEVTAFCEGGGPRGSPLHSKRYFWQVSVNTPIKLGYLPGNP